MGLLQIWDFPFTQLMCQLPCNEGGREDHLLLLTLLMASCWPSLRRTRDLQDVFLLTVIYTLFLFAHDKVKYSSTFTSYLSLILHSIS